MSTTVIRTLSCDLRYAEIHKYGEELSKTIESLAEANDLKKASAAYHAEKIASLEKDVRQLSRKISTKKEDREVKCEWQYRWEEGMKDLVRLDTFQIIETLPISDADHQTRLELEKPENDLPDTPEPEGAAVEKIPE